MVSRVQTVANTLQISEFDLGWFVGILEGEGNISAHINKKSGYLCTSLSVCSTDLDMIEKLDSIYPGKSNYVREYDNHFKTQYVWSVGSREGIRTIIKKVIPYMGIRRQEKMREVISLMDSYEKSSYKGQKTLF